MEAEMAAEAQTRFVTFADVLGFKELVSNNTHDEVMRIYKGTLQKAVDYGVGGGADHDPGLATINMRLMSDSIALWTDTDRASEFEVMLMTVANLLAAGMHYGLPLRSATTWGHAEYWHHDYANPRLKVETLVGDAISEAYKAESNQDWAGGVVLADAIETYEQRAGATAAACGIDGLVEDGWLVHYEVPLKPQRDESAPSTYEAYAVNWTKPYAVESLHVGDVSAPFKDHEKPLSRSVERKISNTLDFVRHVGRLA